MQQSPPPVEVGSGPWDFAAIQGFLESAVIPVRLATLGSGWPLVQSLWFVVGDSALWCCTQHDSVVARRLRKDPRCAFEVAADVPPYRGVRGKGIASLDSEPAAAVLERVISRYLNDENASLAGWLRLRVADEVAIRIEMVAVSSWDYTPRMLSR